MVQVCCDEFYIVAFLFTFRNVIYQSVPSEWFQIDFLPLTDKV